MRTNNNIKYARRILYTKSFEIIEHDYRILVDVLNTGECKDNRERFIILLIKYRNYQHANNKRRYTSDQRNA